MTQNPSYRNAGRIDTVAIQHLYIEFYRITVSLGIVGIGGYRATIDGKEGENTVMKSFILMFFLASGSLVFSDEIADHYSKQTNNTEKAKSRSHSEVASRNHGISEIGIERSGCVGTCPIYTLIVKSDGTFRYNGGSYADRIGKYSGRIPSWQFHFLAQYIRDSNYMKFGHRYSRNVTGSGITYTTVVINGERKTISNYANAGPTELWAIEQLIDQLLTKAKWNKRQESD